MTDTQCSLAEQAMQKAESMARRIWNDPERIHDAVSEAWRLAQSGKGTPSSIARFAIRRVRSWRQFNQSERGIHHSSRRQTADKPKRSEIDPILIVDATNPARIAGVRIDVAEWWKSLPVATRRIAAELAIGENTSTVAAKFGVTPARISQIRAELKRSWHQFLKNE